MARNIEHEIIHKEIQIAKLKGKIECLQSSVYDEKLKLESAKQDLSEALQDLTELINELKKEIEK